MASWIIHFRIADAVLPKLPQNTNAQYFIIGNIAPDCGVPCKGGYNPPSIITHLTNDAGKKDCDYNYIYKNFILGEKDINKWSFYLGYFVHLFTDVQWAYYAVEPLDRERKKLGKDDYKDFFRKVKDDWYSLDFKCFHSEKRPKSFQIFKNAGSFNENYPEFYKNDEITRQMKNIVSFYETNYCDENKTFKYMTEEQADEFVALTAKKAEAQLRLLEIIE